MSKLLHGTTAYRDALESSGLDIGDEFFDTSGGKAYWDGDSWVVWGTSGAAHVYDATLRAGEDQTNDVVVVEQGRFSYETVAASQTAQVIGTTGAAGDYLHHVIVTSSTGTITVLDNATTVAVIPAGAVGVFPINCVSSSGAWKITTAASTTCTCVGRFTA